MFEELKRLYGDSANFRKISDAMMQALKDEVDFREYIIADLIKMYMESQGVGIYAVPIEDFREMNASALIKIHRQLKQGVFSKTDVEQQAQRDSQTGRSMGM